MSLRLCGKQTRTGAAARANASGFAPCILIAGHRDGCDSGRCDPPPPKAA